MFDDDKNYREKLSKEGPGVAIQRESLGTVVLRR